MANNPADPIVNKDRMREIAEEQNVGSHFDGESKREQTVGIDSQVVVDIFKRNVGPDAGTYFLRVSLRCTVNPLIITRYEIDLDKHNTEHEFLKEVEIGGAAIAETQCENRGAKWDCEWIGKQAREAARELLHDIEQQGS